MGYAVAGLLFLRLWKRTKDQLFAAFAVAFWILGVARLCLSLTSESLEGTVFYLLRLLAFLIIIGAIWRKNALSKGKNNGG